MSARPFIVSFLLQFVGAWLAIWMLMQTKGLSYKKKVGFFTVFGLSIALLGEVPAWNWMGFPCGYVLVNMSDLVISWFLAGLAMAKMLKK